MNSYTPVSRRESLKLSAGATCVGGVALVDTIRAGDSRDESDAGSDPAADAGDLRLRAICAEPARQAAVFRVDNLTDEPITAEWAVRDPPAITFPDCETVRIEGTFADVIVDVIWWDAGGLAGTISEPVAGVDGVRTVSVAEAFELDPAAGPVVEAAEAFDTEATVAPGLGDPSRQNPDSPACRAAALADFDDGPTLEEAEADPSPLAAAVAAYRAIEGTLTVPADGSTFLLADAPAGETTVVLSVNGSRVDAAASDPETRCLDLLGDEGGEVNRLLDGLDEATLRRAFGSDHPPADRKALQKAIQGDDTESLSTLVETLGTDEAP